MAFHEKAGRSQEGCFVFSWNKVCFSHINPFDLVSCLIWRVSQVHINVQSSLSRVRGVLWLQRTLSFVRFASKASVWKIAKLMRTGVPFTRSAVWRECYTRSPRPRNRSGRVSAKYKGGGA